MLLFAGGGPATAGTLPCTPQLPVGTVCEADLAQLQPTQFGVGLLQVSDEMRKMKGKSPAKLRKTALKKRIAVVIGPDGGLWLVDRHHFSRALWELGERKAPVSIVGRIDRRDGFWQAMKAAKWAWLYDERGNPRDPADLPPQIEDMPDYSYRALAGFAEDEHLFSKPGQIYFIEFAWARYFGEQLGWAPITAENLSQRLHQARRAACQPAAAGLPGYPGAACRKPIHTTTPGDRIDD
jgi:hypothetical protein